MDSHTERRSVSGSERCHSDIHTDKQLMKMLDVNARSINNAESDKATKAPVAWSSSQARVPRAIPASQRERAGVRVAAAVRRGDSP